MIYDVGTHLGGTVLIPSEDGLVESMRNTISVITDLFSETLTIHRSSTVYSGGKPTITWSSVGTFLGDWQPKSGLTERQQQSLGIECESRIIGEHDVDIMENDKVFREDGTFEYVVYVRRYATHVTVYLSGKKGQD